MQVILQCLIEVITYGGYNDTDINHISQFMSILPNESFSQSKSYFDREAQPYHPQQTKQDMVTFNSPKTIHILCYDFNVVAIDITHPLIGQSFFLQSMIDIMESTSNAQDKMQSLVIPETSMQAHLVHKVLDYAWYHRNVPYPVIEKPLVSHEVAEFSSPWDAEFVNGMNQGELFSIILLSNTFGYMQLLDLTTATIASMIKGKTAEQIRETFNIVNDFTPEEEAQVREENKWLEEA